MSSNLVAEVAAAGVACSVADGLFHPLDTLKTRLHATPTNLSKVIVDAGGGLRAIICLWTSGLAATAARALTFAATRVGAYPSVRDALSSKAAQERGLFNQAYLDTLLESPTDHITPLRGSKLWQVALLEMWLQTHGI